VRLSPAVPLFFALLASACGGESTGVHVTAHVATLSYDELRFGVTLVDPAGAGAAAGDTLVDPATRGRYMAPFSPGDQDVVIYLRDDLDGKAVRCEVMALEAGATRASGTVDVTISRSEMKDVEVFMATPAATPPPPPPTTAPPPDTGGGDTGGGGETDLCKGPLKPKCMAKTKCVAGLCVPE
jgi:hypothetical protein